MLQPAKLKGTECDMVECVGRQFILGDGGEESSFSIVLVAAGQVYTERLGWEAKFFAHKLTSVPCDRDVVEVTRGVSPNANRKDGCRVDSTSELDALDGQTLHLR